MTEAPVKGIIPPHSKENEMMVLGSMLTSIGSLNIAADSLDDSDFYFTEHKIIFQALKVCFKNDKPADVHIICEELKRQNKLSAAGGVAYLTTLAQYAGTSAYIEEYSSLVKNKSLLRRMIYAAQEVEKNALTDPDDVPTALDDAQQRFFTISQTLNSNNGVLIKEIISGVRSESKTPFLKELQERQEAYQLKGPNDPGVSGMPSHYIDLDKLLNGLSPSNLMILAARPAMGKCVTGDTLILNPETGELVPIKEMVQKKSGKVATLGTDWKLKGTSPSAFVADGVKPTFKLTTALGREIEATAVHPLLTILGWKRLEELKVGDRIAVPRSLPYFGTKKWPEHHLKTFAYLVADGNLTDGPPNFTNTNPKIVSDFKEAALAFGMVSIRDEVRHDRAPNYAVSLDRKKQSRVKENFAQAVQEISLPRKQKIFQILDSFGLCKTNIYAWANGDSIPSYEMSLALSVELPELPSLLELVRENPITQFIKKLGLMGKNSHEKFIPNEIFELTRENIALFINRLFSCDGTAYLANCGGNPFPVIAYSSVSKTLIYQVQHLLLRFGIISKIRSKKTTCLGKIFPSFELEIHGRDNLIKFCQDIGVFGKEDATNSVFQYVLSTKPGWTNDSLPIEIWELIREKKGKRGWINLFKAKGLKAPSNMHDGKRSIRRDTLSRIAHVLDDIELMQIASSDVFWDRIVKIESTGEKEVFDLSVNETHNFVAGDIIVHNTALALNIAENVCFKNEIPVGIFSLEMTADQLLHRIVCSQAEVESDKIKTGSLSGAEFQRIVGAVNSMQNHTMVIDDQPGLKITDLRARARRMKEAYNIGLLIVDYLQLLSGSGFNRNSENRQQEISEISRMLKNLARELNIPIICLSQLSRKVEERQGHRPMMSDLRESGSIEQDSDVVMFLLRREYYDPYDKPGMAELIVAKNRHGGVGTVNLTFRKEIAQFCNYSGLAGGAATPEEDPFAAFKQ